MSEQSSHLPLAKVYQLKDLTGWLQKKIEVPPGRIGIALFPDGTERTFQSGSHLLVSLLDRIRGKSAGMICGYLPADSLTVRLRLSLLSGDGFLLDGMLFCAVAIAEPGRFFREAVFPRREIHSNELELDPELVQETLGGLTPQYTANDLTAGRLDAKLLNRVENILNTSIAGQGLQLQEILLFSLARADQRAVIAEQAQALHERLQTAELQQKMAEIENQAQLDDFIRQMAPEISQAAHLSAKPNDPKNTTGTLHGQAGNFVAAWLGTISGQAARGQAWLNSLFKRKLTEVTGRSTTAAKSQNRRSYLWIETLGWVGSAFILGIALTFLLGWLEQFTGHDFKIQLLTIVWGTATTFILERLLYLIKKREELAESDWAAFGYQHIAEMTGNDRQWADQVVRKQCADELRHIQDIISNVRSREYKTGNQSIALTIKKTVENNLQEWLEKVQSASYATPPYVTDLRISRRAWENMLDNDEDILLLVNALAQKAALLQQHSQASGLTLDMLNSFDTEISKFGNEFFQRGRALQAPK